MAAPARRADDSKRRLLHDSQAGVISTTHHLPPPLGGYTFLQHLRSTVAHDTFLAQLYSDDARPLDLVVIRVYALDYLRRHEQCRNFIERQVLVGRAVHHPHVAESLASFATKTDLFVVERYYAGGGLFETVESYFADTAAEGSLSSRSYSGLPLVVVRHITRELMLAVHYLHRDMQLAHRNIKLENILLDEANHVHLSGLGLCAFIGPATLSAARTVDDVDAEDSAQSPGGRSLRLCCGSKHYIAPELLDGRPYDGTGVDVWAAGVVLFTLVSGAFPFDAADASTVRETDQAVFAGIRDAEAVLEAHPAFQALPDPCLQDLLRGMLKTNPAVRLSVDEVLQHPFLSTKE